MCTPLPSHDWVDYLQALLTPTIAVIAALIAYLQWRTNSLRLKHDRFDRHFGIFEATRVFISDLIKRGGLNEDARQAFLSATSGAQFLFGKKITTYLDDLHSKACDLEQVNIDRHDCDPEDIGRLSKKENSLKHDLINDLKKLEGTFKKYM